MLSLSNSDSVAAAIQRMCRWITARLPAEALQNSRTFRRKKCYTPLVDLELQRLRRHDRRLTWEDLLRDRPEVLYRTACEWIWMHDGPDSTSRLWQR